jgi:hypothetical protein
MNLGSCLQPHGITRKDHLGEITRANKAPARSPPANLVLSDEHHVRLNARSNFAAARFIGVFSSSTE